MRRWISLVLVLALALTQTYVFAEAEPEGEQDLLGSIGNFLGSTWDAASDAAGEAWGDVSDAAGEVWDDVSKTAGEAWDSVSAAAGEAWDWASCFAAEQYGAASEKATGLFNDLKSWISITGEGAPETLHDVFNILTKELGIAEDKAAELWNTISEYAKQNNISLVTMAKLTLAILVRLTLGGTLTGDMDGQYISDTVIAWFTDNDIHSEEAAENALAGLEQSLIESPIN